MSLAGSNSRNPLKVLSSSELLAVQRPAQYLGGEHNSVKKSEEDVDVNFALAFPDTYEVGMSHQGYQILYSILNGEEKTWAERVYMPLPDMSELLERKGASLSSLESNRPIRDFDVVGFSLQYELCGTNILAMLDLSAIPRWAKDRTGQDPIVIGGGPFAYHPETLAPFFDAFLLGDAEEAILDITAAIRENKNSKFEDSCQARRELISKLAEIEGVYVPSRYTPSYKEDGTLESIERDPHRETVVRRLLPSLAGAPYPKKPIVPNVQTVHNRLSVEVMRGCVRGCRFCQAGYLYRPQRERSPREIVEMIDATLPETGFEELSLLSLSTADYCSVVPLLKELMNKHGEDEKLAISFPSTRVDALTPEVLEQVQRVRRTNFTVAPEAGTQRLRDVINKGVTDEEIVQCARNVFGMGWTGIKLYFMMGLPTETDEDLQGIIDTAARLKALPEAKGKDITVSVSTFVPKPHTPFQWCEQITPEETIRRQRILSDALKKLRVKFRYHDSFSTFLEGLFCRADRKFAHVIERAYELGCRLDGWSEHLREDLWLQACNDCGVDPYHSLRERELDEVLPWDHLSCGIPKSYFAKEYRRATRDKVTPDCLTTSCSVCGACDYEAARNVLWPRKDSEDGFEKRKKLEPVQAEETPVSRVRIRFGKSDEIAYLGHLEMVALLHRAMRRAALPLAYTLGFHPKPKVSFGPPLQLGIETMVEYADLFLVRKMESNSIVDYLNGVLPDSLRVFTATEIDLKNRSLQDSLISQSFKVKFLGDAEGVFSKGTNPEQICTMILDTTIERTTFKRGRRGPRKQVKSFLLSDFLSAVSVGTETSTGNTMLEFTLDFDLTRASPRPLEIVDAISGLNVGGYEITKVSCELRDENKVTVQNAIELSHELEMRD
jgi:radical SAM family uncharacterized protein/radical SAM-linked protein